MRIGNFYILNSDYMKQQTRLLDLNRNLGKHLAMLLTFMLVAVFSIGQTTNTWKGGTSGLWSNTANWSRGSVPSATDIVTFDGNAINGTNGNTGNITVTAIPTGSTTIGQLKLLNSANVSLQATTGVSATLLVGNSNYTGDEISVPVGSTLNIATNPSGVTTETLTIGLAATAGVTAQIDGTLTISPNATTTGTSPSPYANSTPYTSGAFVTNAGNLYTASTGTSGTTATISGVLRNATTAKTGGTVDFTWVGSAYNGSSTVFAKSNSNAYNAANGATTITGTLNYAGTISGLGGTGTLTFSNTSTFNQLRIDGIFPTGTGITYTSVNVNINNAQNSGGQVPVTFLPNSIGTLTINDAGIVAPGILAIVSVYGGTSTGQSIGSGTGNNLNNLTVSAGRVGIGLNTTSVTSLTIGSGGLNVSGGTFVVANASSASTSTTITVNGALTLSSTGQIQYFNAGAVVQTATMTVNSYTQTGTSTLNLNTQTANGTGTLNVLGDFSCTAGTITQTTQVSTTIANLVMKGTTGNQTFTTGGTITKINIQINNTSTAPNNTVTLGSNYTMTSGATTSCTLQLTAGLLTLSTYTLQIANVTGGIVGSTASGGATLGLSAAYGTGNYIDASSTGVFKISGVPATATTFPLGATFSGTKYYLPLVFTSVANSPTISVGCATAFANSVSDATKVVKAQWSIQSSAASGTPTVTFQFTGTTSDILGSAYVTSGSVLGIYANSAYSETAATVTNSSGTYTTPVSLTLPTAAASLYGVGNTGAFSTAASITLASVSKYSNDANFTLTPTSANTLGAYSFSSGTTSVATVNSTSGLVTIVGPGTTTITVNQAANGSYAAGTTTAVITVIGVYTWNGATSDYQVTTNWTPTRTSPANSDVLQFNANATVTNVATQIIGRLVLSNNAQVSLQETSGTSATLTVGNSTTRAMASGDEISIPSGCTLTLAQNASGGSEILTLQLISSVSGVTSGIYGTLTIAQNTATTYANVYSAVNGVTTIYGTGVINYAGSFGNSTVTSLIYKNGSTINNQRADATFSGASGTTLTERVNVSFSGSNCGTSGTGQIPINNLPAYIGTLTINATGATGTMNVRGISGGSGTTQSVDITTLTVSSTGTGSFGFGSNTTAVSSVNVGSGGITVTGGKLNLAYNVGQTITVSGDLSISNSSLVSLCSSGSNTTYTGRLTVNNYTQTGTSTFRLNANGGSGSLLTNYPTSILTVKGNFSVDATSTFTNQVSGAPNSIVMNGGATQSITASGTFTNVDALQLEINNTATSTVTLNSAMPTIGTLTMTKGQLVLSSNSLTTAAISGGSSTAYVNAISTGRLKLLAVPTSATTFPIGTATSYAPVTLTGGTAGADISMGVKNTFAPRTPNIPNNVVNLEWAMVVGNSISTTPTVKFQYNANTDPAGGYVSAGAILGTYEAGSYTESTSAFTIDATTPIATTATIAFTNDLPTSTENYYGIGNPNSFAVSGLPTKPTIGTATISGSSVSVSFTAPVDAVATGVTGYLVTSSPGGITATGTTSPISISGLGGGTSYTFTVKSVNAFGNSPASTASNSVTTPVYTYTWTGATNSNYQTATNWSPNRTTPTTSDKIQFSSSATVINVPTQTIGRLALSNNGSVSLQPTSGTSATLSVGNTTAHTNGVDDINVPTGCTLTMAANASGGAEFLTLQLASAVTGVTANIAGTLTIAQNTSSTYANTYNTANGVTTISGTVNYAGGFSNISSTSLLFTTNSTINNQRGDASFPAAFAGTYTRVNVSITGATSTTQVPVSNLPASINTLTINDAGITGSGVLLVRSISGGSGTSQVADITNLTVTNGIVGFGTNASAVATVTVGSGGINVSGGKLLLAYNSAQTITVTGGINLSGTGVISMCSAGGSAFAASLTTTNFTQTGASTFYVNGYFGSAPLPTATMNVTGNFSVGSGSLFSQATGVTGTLVFNSTNASQTISSAGTISNISTVQVNNTAASPNNKVTLTSAFTMPKALTLTSGTIALGTNTLTVGGTLTNNTTISGTGIVNLNSGTAQSIAGTGGTISNLTLSTTGTTVTISGAQNITGTLKVNTGTTLNTGGLLTLKSSSITNSAIVDVVGGTISGNVTVERYIPAGYRGYRDLAPQVYNASTTTGSMYKNWQENGDMPKASGNTYTSGTGIFITGSAATLANTGSNYANATYTSGQPAPTVGSNWLDYSINGNTSAYKYTNGSLYNASNSGFVAVTDTKAENLDVFSGYRVLVRGDRSFNLATTPIINYYNVGLRMVSATTLRATGQLVTGTVTYNNDGVVNAATGVNTTSTGTAPTSTHVDALTSSTVNGFSMVANPYVCPVQWGTGVTGTQTGNTNTVFGNSTNINGSYWYLDPTQSAAGKYIAFNAITGSASVGGSTYPGSFNGTTNNSSGYIQAGQAFFVQSSSANPTVVFTENCKAVSSTKTSVFGVTAPLSKIYLSLLKEDSATVYTQKDGAAIAFAKSFGNTTYGPQDALKFGSANDNLYLLDKGKNLSIDGRLPATATDVLPIALNKMSGKNYQLVIDASSYDANGYIPLLKDNYRGVVKELTLAVNSISFTVDTTIAASYANRFSLGFKPTTLPVSSIAASATLSNKIATINWSTVGEKGVSRFEVEKSTDAKSFTKIGQAIAKNTATAAYSTTDNNVVSTTSYYRIKAISEVGTVSYSNIVKVSTDNRLPSYSLYPNPLKGTKVVNVSLVNVAAGKYTVTITNVLGQKVQEVAISHAGGNGSNAITVNSAIAAGTYSVTVRDVSGKSVYQSNLSVQP